jgi:hypothetical protein
MTRTHANQFPDITIPAEILALVAEETLVDTSWANDVCASFETPAVPLGLRLWVEAEKPAEREMPGPRFTLDAVACGKGSDPHFWETLYKTERADVAAAFVSTVCRMQGEIAFDLAAGRFDRRDGRRGPVRSFADLHDHVDANEYGGACDDANPYGVSGGAWGQPQGEIAEDDATRHQWQDFWNAAQEFCDRWIKAGGLTA